MECRYVIRFDLDRCKGWIEPDLYDKLRVLCEHHATQEQDDSYKIVGRMSHESLDRGYALSVIVKDFDEATLNELPPWIRDLLALHLGTFVAESSAHNCSAQQVSMKYEVGLDGHARFSAFSTDPRLVVMANTFQQEIRSSQRCTSCGLTILNLHNHAMQPVSSDGLCLSCRSEAHRPKATEMFSAPPMN